MAITGILILAIIGLLLNYQLCYQNKEGQNTEEGKIKELPRKANQAKIEETEDIKEENKELPAALNFEVSFEIVHIGESITFCYTNDPDSLWNYIPWAKEIKSKMESLSTYHVILFNSKENTPDLKSYEFNISSEFEPFMVCRYLVFANGNTEFCFGGKKEDGRWVDCRVQKPKLP